MKRLVVVMGLVFWVILAKAQLLEPVKLSYAAKRVGKNEAVVYVRAKIDKGWHIYSLFQKDGGPQKSVLSFAGGSGYSLVGNASEPTPIKKFEEVFKMEVAYFEGSVTFSQRIRLKVNSAVVKGSLEFMCCNDHECLPPKEVEFSIPVK